MKWERLKLESSWRSWKVRGEVGKFELSFSLNFPLQQNFPTSAKLFNFERIFPTSVGFYQLCSVLSNFARFFPTSLRSSQLRQALSNLNRNFPISDFPTPRSFQLPFRALRIPSGRWVRRTLPSIGKSE